MKATEVFNRCHTTIVANVVGFARYNPRVIVPFFDWHATSALGNRQQQPPPEIFEINTFAPDLAANVMFTGQDHAALTLWEQNKTIYSIDADLWAELGETDDSVTIPAGLLTHLPHPDPFVAFPEPLDIPLDNGLVQRVSGFFLTGRRVVGGLGATQQSTHGPGTNAYGLLVCGLVHNPDGSPLILTDGVQDIALTRLTIQDGMTIGEMVEESSARFLSLADDFTDWQAHLPAMLRAVMSTLVYLCATNADLRPVPVPPRKTKSGRRVKDTNATRVVEVGYRLGAALREYRSQASGEGSAGTGRKVAPHVRRSHFHTYRVGPGRAEARVKWLGPINVNLNGPADRPTVHRVQRKGTP
jgi:hypothetical protein